MSVPQTNPIRPELNPEIRAGLASLPDVLRRFDYSGPNLRARLGTAGLVPPNTVQARHCDRQTSDGSDSSLIIRWLNLNMPVELDRLTQIAPNQLITALIELQLMRIDGDKAISEVSVVPFHGKYFLTDPLSHLYRDDKLDHVLAPGPTTDHLVHFLGRRPVEATLDLGTGTGALAIIASDFSKSVAAIDINQRAISMTAFNAAVNGADNVEAIAGDRFGPIAGRSFDRIITNPPFIMAPGHEFTYRDNDEELDKFCHDLIRQAPQHLTDNGLFQMLFEWAELTNDGGWDNRLRATLEEIDCDGWVIRGNTYSPSSYAQHRISETAPALNISVGEEFDRWMAYYEANDVFAVHGGLLLARRRPGPNWIRMEAAAFESTPKLAEEVAATINCMDLLRETPDHLLDTCFTLAVDTKLVMSRTYQGDGEWSEVTTQIVRSGPIERVVVIDTEIARFIDHLDRSRTLRSLIEEVVPGSHTSAEQVTLEVLSTMQHLLRLGLVVPAMPDTTSNT